MQKNNNFLQIFIRSNTLWFERYNVTPVLLLSKTLSPSGFSSERFNLAVVSPDTLNLNQLFLVLELKNPVTFLSVVICFALSPGTILCSGYIQILGCN